MGGKRGKGVVRAVFYVSPPWEELEKRFGAAAQRLQDFRPVWNKATEVITEIHRGVYASHGASIGVPWKPHSKRYDRWLQRKGLPRAALLVGKTGNLREQATTKKGLKSRNKLSMKFALRGKHVRAINFGRKKRKGHRTPIPKRPIIFDRRKYEPPIGKLINDHVARVLLELKLSKGAA